MEEGIAFVGEIWVSMFAAYLCIIFFIQSIYCSVVVDPFCFLDRSWVRSLVTFFYRQFFPLIAFLFFCLVNSFLLRASLVFLSPIISPNRRHTIYGEAAGVFFFFITHIQNKGTLFLSYFLLSTTPMFSKKKKVMHLIFKKIKLIMK